MYINTLKPLRIVGFNLGIWSRVGHPESGMENMTHKRKACPRPLDKARPVRSRPAPLNVAPVYRARLVRDA